MGKIHIVQGDITQQTTEAIVNAANNHLWMGSGVAGAIKRAGGDAIEKEAISKGPLPVGEAIATSAGSLPAKVFIHAAAMGEDLKTDAVKIRSATRNSLLRSEEMGLRSIAFPALGTGIGGFPLSECARIMLDAVKSYLQGQTWLEEVVFVLWDTEAYHTFERELARR